MFRSLLGHLRLLGSGSGASRPGAGTRGASASPRARRHRGLGHRSARTRLEIGGEEADLELHVDLRRAVGPLGHGRRS